MLTGAGQKCYESSDEIEVHVDWVSEKYQRRLLGGGETAAGLDGKKDGGVWRGKSRLQHRAGEHWT